MTTNQKGEGASTFKCLNDESMHYFGTRSSNGYVMDVCVTCGTVFKFVSGPEIDKLEAENGRLLEEQNRVRDIAIKKENLDRKEWESVTEMTVGMSIQNLQADNLRLRTALEKIAGPFPNATNDKVYQRIARQALQPGGKDA